METFSGKINASIDSSKEIAGLNKKKKKKKMKNMMMITQKSRLTIFSHGELIVCMNLLGICIARSGSESSYLCVLKGYLGFLAEF